MLLSCLLFIPILGIFLISTLDPDLLENRQKVTTYKRIALVTTLVNLIVSLVIFILFDFSNSLNYEGVAPGQLTEISGTFAPAVREEGGKLSSSCSPFQFLCNGGGGGGGLDVMDFSNYSIINLAIDGQSIYFVLLTTLIMPIALLSNWNSIGNGLSSIKSYLIIILLLESLLLAVFLVVDVLLFYVFFESILIPLFLLIGLFGSYNKVRASFYLFLYTFH